MKINDYEALVRKTAIYPHSHTFVYPVLGLCGEIGEVLDKVFPTNYKEAVTNEVVKELGDVMWYITATALDIGCGLRGLVYYISGSQEVETFDDLDWWLLKTNDIRSPYLRLTVNSGVLAEIAKKGIRDNNGIFNNDEVKVKAETYLADTLHTMFMVAKRLGVSIGDITKLNHDKLIDRLNRGKIKGDGDNR